MGWFLLGLPHCAVGGAFRPASLYFRQIVHELLLHPPFLRRARVAPRVRLVASALLECKFAPPRQFFSVSNQV